MRYGDFKLKQHTDRPILCQETSLGESSNFDTIARRRLHSNQAKIDVMASKDPGRLQPKPLIN